MAMRATGIGSEKEGEYEFELRSHGAQAGLELLIFLFPTSKCGVIGIH